MESDPAVGHIDGCEPIDYSETKKTYQPVFEENPDNMDNYGNFRAFSFFYLIAFFISTPIFSDFPLEKTARNDTFLPVHRFQDDPSKCLRFQYMVSFIYNTSTIWMFLQNSRKRTDIEENIMHPSFYTEVFEFAS